MSNMTVEEFEPVYLEVQGPARLTEYGKQWLDDRVAAVEKHWSVLKDVCKLAAHEATRWVDITEALKAEGVPVAITSGMSQVTMAKSLDNSTGKTSFTLPGTVALALATTAPTSTTTGVTVVEATYTGYGRQTIAGGGWNAATAATPSVATNNGAITFAACTASTSTLLGFLVADNATTSLGNALWYGTLASTVISTTQTPATIASAAMSLSMTGT